MSVVASLSRLQFSAETTMPSLHFWSLCTSSRVVTYPDQKYDPSQPKPHPLHPNDAPALPGRWVRSKSPSVNGNAATTGHKGSAAAAAGDTCDVTHVRPPAMEASGNIDDGYLITGTITPASPLLLGGAAPVRGEVSNRPEVNGAVDFSATTVRRAIVAGCTQTEHRLAFGCLRRKRVDLSSIALPVLDLK